MLIARTGSILILLAMFCLLLIMEDYTPIILFKQLTMVFPDLPGCVTEGDTLPEAMDMAIDAAQQLINQ